METQLATHFSVLKHNAEKFQHNKELRESRQRRLQQAGVFRTPTNASWSFQASYGAAKELAGFDSMTVRATDGTQTLLKHALAVPRGSGEPVQRLTRPGVPQAVRLGAVRCLRSFLVLQLAGDAPTFLMSHTF